MYLSYRRRQTPTSRTSQQAHNIKMTSYQRRCDVITSHRRWYDVILTSCAHWDGFNLEIFIGFTVIRWKFYYFMKSCRMYKLKSTVPLRSMIVRMQDQILIFMLINISFVKRIFWAFYTCLNDDSERFLVRLFSWRMTEKTQLHLNVLFI